MRVVLGGLTARARFDSSSRFSLPPSVIIRLTFPGRTRSTLLYFCAVQPSLQSQHWLAFYSGLFPFPTSLVLILQPIVCPTHLVSVTIESCHIVRYHEQPKQYLGSGFTYLQPQPQTSILSYGHELYPGLDGSKVVFAKRQQLQPTLRCHGFYYNRSNAQEGFTSISNIRHRLQALEFHELVL